MFRVKILKEGCVRLACYLTMQIKPKDHNHAILWAQQFIRSYENSTKSIDYNPNMPIRYDKHMQILMRIIDVVLTYGRQGIALRTHRGNLDDPFIRNNKFIAILKGFANIDNTFKNYLKYGPKNAKMCSAKNSEWNHCLHCKICWSEK